MSSDRTAAVHSAVSFGSGYWVQPGLVLTAAHVVLDDAEPAAHLQVRARDGWTDAEIAWWDGDHDVALLRTAPGGPPATARFGRLVGDGEVQARSRGYPRAEAAPGGQRAPHQASGLLSPGTRPVHGKGRIAFNVATAVPEDTPAGSPWQGMSGAAVTCGPYVVAVLVDDPTGWQPDRLNASRIDVLADDFWDVVGAGMPRVTVAALAPGQERWASICDLDAFEQALSADLSSLGLAPLTTAALRSLGIDDAPTETEPLAGIVARELRQGLAGALDGFVGAIADVARDVAGRVYRALGPYSWLDESARRAVRTYLEALSRRRVIVVPSRRSVVAEACVCAAAGTYRVLPPAWKHAKVNLPVDFAADAAYPTAVADAMVAALGYTREALADELGVDAQELSADLVAAEFSGTTFVLQLHPKVDDALLASLRSSHPSLVFVALEGENRRVRLDALRADGGLPIEPPFDNAEADVYARTVLQLASSGIG